MYLVFVFGYFGLTPVGAFPLGAMMSGPESSTPAGQRLPRKDDNDDDSHNDDHNDNGNIVVTIIIMLITWLMTRIIKIFNNSNHRDEVNFK